MSNRICAACQQKFYADEDWKKICLTCWKKKKNRDTGNTPFQRVYVRSDIEIDLLDNLDAVIRLCHPDKHGNSESSNRITKWLLELRANQKRGAA